MFSPNSSPQCNNISVSVSLSGASKFPVCIHIYISSPFTARPRRRRALLVYNLFGNKPTFYKSEFANCSSSAIPQSAEGNYIYTIEFSSQTSQTLTQKHIIRNPKHAHCSGPDWWLLGKFLSPHPLYVETVLHNLFTRRVVASFT